MSPREEEEGDEERAPAEEAGGHPTGAVKEACPAFADGCPYATGQHIIDWLKSKKPDETHLCPAFDDGCPFRTVKDLEALRLELQKLPPSHAGPIATAAGGADVGPAKEANLASTAAHAALLEMLQAVHQTSQSVKEVVGGDCPVFQQACPFKNCVTSNGTPLVLALETRSWGLLIHEEGADSAADAAPPASGEAGGAAPGGAEPEAEGEGLAKKLKVGTKDAHKAAETVHFVREFIKGKVPREVYAQMVVNLYYVYEALEAALDKCCDHPLVDPLHFPEELRRADTLARDAEFFLGPNWRETTEPSAVTREYVARLREVSDEAPELIVPHAYTRYLGDLSGGQVLKRAAVRGMSLPDDGSGVQFYTFKRIPDGKVFKNMYRARLDALPADTGIADRMVTEANLAFGLNTRMFQELDVLMGFSASDPPPPPPLPEPPKAADAAACPFAALAASGVPMPADHPTLGGGKKKAGAGPGKPPSTRTAVQVAGVKGRLQGPIVRMGTVAVVAAALAVLLAWSSRFILAD